MVFYKARGELLTWDCYETRKSQQKMENRRRW